MRGLRRAARFARLHPPAARCARPPRNSKKKNVEKKSEAKIEKKISGNSKITEKVYLTLRAKRATFTF